MHLDHSLALQKDLPYYSEYKKQFHLILNIPSEKDIYSLQIHFKFWQVLCRVEQQEEKNTKHFFEKKIQYFAVEHSLHFYGIHYYSNYKYQKIYWSVINTLKTGLVKYGESQIKSSFWILKSFLVVMIL